MDQVTMKGPRLAKRVDEHVGERIRQRRTMLGYTQEQLAGALNISYQQVQKYETGANRVSAGRLYEIASHLDIDMGYFFEGLAPTARSGPMPHGGRNRTTIELVRNFADIGDGELRNALSSLVKVLALRLGDEATRAIPVNGTDAAASNHGADGN